MFRLWRATGASRPTASRKPPYLQVPATGQLVVWATDNHISRPSRPVTVLQPRSMALLFDPCQDFRLREAEVGLNSHVGDQAALDVPINRLHVDFQHYLEFPCCQHLRPGRAAGLKAGDLRIRPPSIRALFQCWVNTSAHRYPRIRLDTQPALRVPAGD